MPAVRLVEIPGTPALGVYTEARFEETVQKMQEGIARGDMNQAAFRVFMASVELARVDAQNRITLSARMRERVGLDRQAHIVGMWNRLEIWNPDTFAETEESTVEAGVDMGQYL